MSRREKDSHLTSLDGRLIPYARWFGELPALRARYAANEPFPHIVLDQFLQPEAAEQLLVEFPAIASAGWIYQKHVNENKLGMQDRSTFGPMLGAAIDELNSQTFVRFLSDLTSIDGLLADPTLQGGGIHQSERGGYLNIHADFTIHPYRRHWRRRINVLVYLNKDWQDSYGGHLEMWDRQMQRCVQKIAPLFNRAVIFNTEDSFHGHPEPMSCPPEVTRKSLALYYFTAESVPPVARSTQYRARPGDGIQALWIYLDTMVLRCYTAMKWRFGLSDRVASRVLQVLSKLTRK